MQVYIIQVYMMQVHIIHLHMMHIYRIHIRHVSIMHICVMHVHIMHVHMKHVCRMQVHMRYVSMIHMCVMHVKNGDGHTNGKLNSRSRMSEYRIMSQLKIVHSHLKISIQVCHNSLQKLLDVKNLSGTIYDQNSFSK